MEIRILDNVITTKNNKPLGEVDIFYSATLYLIVPLGISGIILHIIDKHGKKLEGKKLEVNITLSSMRYLKTFLLGADREKFVEKIDALPKKYGYPFVPNMFRFLSRYLNTQLHIGTNFAKSISKKTLEYLVNNVPELKDYEIT